MSISVLLVDDQELMRMGLRMVLGGSEDIVVAGEASDGAAAVIAAAELAPDVILMDINMPILDGIEATRQIAQMPNGPTVLVMTTFDLDEHVLRALRAGAAGFLLKDTPPDQLVAAVRAVAIGDSVVSPKITRRLLERFIVAPPSSHTGGPDAHGAGTGTDPGSPAALARSLTEREQQTLHHVAHGLSNAEIAGKMGVSEATVKTHVGKVLFKLNLRDRVQAVVFAYEAGIVRPGR